MCIFCLDMTKADEFMENRLTDEELLEVAACPELQDRVPVTIGGFERQSASHG